MIFAFIFIAAHALPWCYAEITSSTFGWVVESGGERREVRRYTLQNSDHVRVDVLDYGATIAAILVPDRQGQLHDVTLGFDDMDGYVNNTVNPYFGATIGRVANRIGGASFSIGGRRYNITANSGRNQLHGGFKGFDKRVWEGHVEGERLTLSYLSADGEEGYPGQVLAHVTYWLSEQHELHVQMLATATKPTPLNFANHAYFNLAGHNAGADELYNHRVTINADSYTPASDADNVPTGEIRNVAGSVLDLRSPKLLKDVIPLTPQGSGFDHNYCVNQGVQGQINFVARVVHPGSGRVLEIFSDQPGVQFYTSNFLPSENRGLKGKDGAVYKKHGALCLETQNYPDAINKPTFPNSILYPGESYTHKMKLRFSTMITTD